MQREGARPGARTDLVQTRDQPSQVQFLSVLIPAQMRVRIHDDGVGGQQRMNLSHERPIRIGRIHERILAGRQVLLSPGAGARSQYPQAARAPARTC